MKVRIVYLVILWILFVISPSVAMMPDKMIDLSVIVLVDDQPVSGAAVTINSNLSIATDGNGRAGPFKIDNSSSFIIEASYGNRTFKSKRYPGTEMTGMRATVSFRSGKKTQFTFTKTNTNDTNPTCRLTISVNPVNDREAAYDLLSSDGTAIVQNGSFDSVNSNKVALAEKDVARPGTYVVKVYLGGILNSEKSFRVRKFDVRKNITLKARAWKKNPQDVDDVRIPPITTATPENPPVNATAPATPPGLVPTNRLS